MLSNLFLITQTELEKIVNPIIELCNVLVPVMLTIVGALGGIWVIILCVKYAKADDPQEHEKAKKGLKNAVIGFVLIFVLLIMLEVGMTYLSQWVSTYEF